MKKKQLEKYINEYRATTKVSPDKDLCKRVDTTPQTTAEKPARLPVYRRLSFWGVAVIVLVIAFVLPIALSMELNSKANTTNIVNPPTTDDGISDNNAYLIYEKDLSYNLIDSIQAFHEAYAPYAHLPTINYADGRYQEIRLASDNKTIGFVAELSIVSETYFSLSVFTIEDNYKIEGISFDDFTDELSINDIVIKYKYIINEDYVYSMEFKRDGYLYQAIVTCYDETPIETILSDCFGL